MWEPQISQHTDISCVSNCLSVCSVLLIRHCFAPLYARFYTSHLNRLDNHSDVVYLITLIGSHVLHVLTKLGGEFINKVRGKLPVYQSTHDTKSTEVRGVVINIPVPHSRKKEGCSAWCLTFFPSIHLVRPTVKQNMTAHFHVPRKSSFTFNLRVTQAR